MKTDLNTPFSILFPEVILVWVWLSLSLIGICFLRGERGDLFPGAFSVCAQSSDFNAIFHYTMMALTFKGAVVSGYGNRAINLNSSSALECGVTAWTFHTENPSRYCKKRSVQVFHPCYESLSIFPIFSQALSLLAKGKSGIVLPPGCISLVIALP